MAGPLDRWLAECLDPSLPQVRPEDVPDVGPTVAPDRLEAWRWARLTETVDRAKRLSPFYRRHLRDVDPASLRGPADLPRIPPLDPEILRQDPESLLCASRDDISRVVTLQSSGTSGPSKRVFYTAGDIERTVHFFRRGMTPMVEPGRGALILLPGERPDSVGDQLAQALRFHRVEPLVAAPAHAQVLATHFEAAGLPNPRLRAALLCWDSVPDAVAATVRRVFGCAVLRHWGMVETGLGGAVECADGSGLHLRAADLYVEITDPATGAPLPPGTWGELVVTTLRRRAMPIVRYRTGDLARLLPGTCACGSPLPRMDAHLRRIRETTLPGGADLADLNEILYAVPGLADFTARLSGSHASETDDVPEANSTATLHLEICAAAGYGDAAASPDARAVAVLDRARSALNRLPSLADAVEHGRLKLNLTLCPGPGPARPGLAKRNLLLEF